MSFGCALLAGVAGVTSISAMFSGVLSWCALCAGATASQSYGRWASAGEARQKSLWQAVWLRAGFTGLAGMPFVLGRYFGGGGDMNPLMIPDLVAGMASISAANHVAAGFGAAATDAPEGFLTVYLCTMIQGLWVVATVVGLGGVIHGGKWLWRKGPLIKARGVIDGTVR